MEHTPTQYIPVEFRLLDSEIITEWDKRGFALYLKLRRYVCRSHQHNLAAYWQSGYLAVEGYLGSWAKWLGVSKPTVSRLLKWMEEHDIIIRDRKSRRFGDTNIYILGQVLHIEGSDRPTEMFFLDHLAAAQTTIRSAALPSKVIPILPMDVAEFALPITTVSPVKQTVSPQKQTVSPVKPFNKEDSNKEERIETSSFSEQKPTKAKPKLAQERLPMQKLEAVSPAVDDADPQTVALLQEIHPDLSKLTVAHLATVETLVRQYGPARARKHLGRHYAVWCETKTPGGAKYNPHNPGWIEWAEADPPVMTTAAPGGGFDC